MQDTINQQLKQLRLKQEQVSALRLHVGELEKLLATVKDDYERVLAPLNQEATRLERRIASLRAGLQKKPLAPAIRTRPIPSVKPPITRQQQARAPKRSARAVCKGVLADHIESMIEDAARDQVMPLINAVLADERRDLGDMLELMPWGSIWTNRTPWETAEEQSARLDLWAKELTARQTYWQKRLNRLESDPAHGLLAEKAENSAEAWQLFLASLADSQEQKNKRLQAEIDFLEEETADDAEDTDD